MSGGDACRIAAHRPQWYVTQRYCNHSAFNGYRQTRSNYSTVRCPTCPASWRTKAMYVGSLPDAPPSWAQRA